MRTILNKELTSLKEELIKYLDFGLQLSKEAIKSLKKSSPLLATDVLEKEAYSKIYMDSIIEESMYILTQHPLDKDLRRVISYQSICKNIDMIIHNSMKIAKFQMRSDDMISATSKNRINKTFVIYEEALTKLIKLLKIDSPKKKEIMSIISYYPSIKNVVLGVRIELENSLISKKEISSIKERIFTFSICEAIQRNLEKIVYIAEYLLFILDGKNHSYIR